MTRVFDVIKLSFLLLLFCLLSFAARAQDETEKLIEKLTNLPGVSGFEEPVRNALLAQWKAKGVDVSVDNVGNVIARVGSEESKDNKKTDVLIMAHMDEVGFIITDIDERGYIKAKALGGWLDHVLWGHRWSISVGDNIISAFTGMDAPHVLTDFRSSPPVTSAQLFFDTGLTRQQLQDKGVRPGLPVTPAAHFMVLDSGKRYAAKALDDRALLAVMSELLSEVSQNPQAYQHLNLTFAATVQEEVGMRGAAALAGQIDADVILNLEAGIAKDYPTQFTHESEPKLGKGPALFIYDGSMLPDSSLVTFIHDVARRNNIPTQWESEQSYGQDASSFQFSGKGVRAINLALPVRYAHSHWGIMDRQDYDSMLALLKATLRDMGRNKP
ncbi:endo-1,4 beta-glucanase [Erwinia amylovora Ea644]|uniref:M42 family metallopeptidase n=1 Tax=Erwinia amylovora TaxID=552 RepID=UPI0002C9F705|nr:M42 family metallopeptidase [Erwinia amylovora]CCP01689.1 endo-1,4 beta-glucanase [Erwinia amylovora Ea644]CCP05686.1 hypothetical protein BN440_0635 [Erwinia amylovora MR1]